MISKHRCYYSLWVLVLMVVALLISCGGNPEISIPPTFTKENAVTVANQTLETPIASPFLISQTGTMEPTLAYWATAQAATFHAQSTQAATTQQAIFGMSTQHSQMCGYQLEGVSTSPDRQWIATDCRFDRELFRVFQTHGNQVWDIPYSGVMKYYPEFIGSVRALHWSADGNSLYFASSSCCADTGAITNGDTLYRLDLQTGDWTVVTQEAFSYYSFSPDGERLAYLLNNQASANDFLRLHILNLSTGIQEFIDVDGFGQGWVVWKDNGQKIALIATNGSIYDAIQNFSLIVVDLRNKNQQLVILNTEDRLGIINWSNDDILTISRSNVMELNDYYVNVFDVMIYDLKTNVFITPTVIP